MKVFFDENEVVELSYNNANHSVVVDEVNNGGFLPGKTMVNITKSHLTISACDFLKTDLNALGKKFYLDTTYRDEIYEMFDSLITEKNIFSLTYNIIFSTFWSLIKRNKNDSRKDVLQEKLYRVSDAIKKINKDDHRIIYEWINDSFNQTYEINEIVLAAEKKVPALVFDSPIKFAPERMLHLAKSCGPKILSLIVEMLSNLRLVETEEELPKYDPTYLNKKGLPEPVKYIPLSISNKYLFNILPHLMAPGSFLSLRSSILMAAISYVTSNVYLKDRAREHLEHHKGKWIDFELPENYAGEFSKLMLRVPEFLTEKEVMILTDAKKFYGLSLNEKTEFILKKSITPFKKVCNDYKHKCDYCGMMRSFTIMTVHNGTYKCGMCWYDIGDETEPCDNNHSVYLECRKCNSHYSIVRPDLLHEEPKCHGCRNGLTTNFVTCGACTNKFCDPSGIFKNKNFTCSDCKIDPKLCLDEKTVSFRDIYSQNLNTICSLVGLKITTEENVFGGGSMYYFRNDITKINPVTDISSLVIKYQGKHIFNSGEILKSMMEWIFFCRSRKRNLYDLF